MYFNSITTEIILVIFMFDISIWAAVGMNKFWKWIEKKPIKEERSTPIYITRKVYE